MEISRANEVVEIIEKIKEVEKQLSLFKQIQKDVFVQIAGKNKDEKTHTILIDDGGKSLVAAYTNKRIVENIRMIIEQELRNQLTELRTKLNKY